MLIIAFICTGLFAGAALYVSLVEHPARMSCDVSVALAEFRPSYKRAAVMQVILALGGAVAAIAAFYFGNGVSSLVAGIVLATVIPWTLIVIMPITRQLMDETRTSETRDTDVLLKKWGRLHNVRTVAGLLALAILAANIIGFV
jgi:TM2 domain-containing membrane protein YozV